MPEGAAARKPLDGVAVEGMAAEHWGLILVVDVDGCRGANRTGLLLSELGSGVGDWILLLLLLRGGDSRLLLRGCAVPDPVPDDCTDSRWKWFKGCLGALDDTYINVTVPLLDKPRYRTRKGHICTNALAVCDRNLRFVYVLSGWEGSASDSRVLRDAVNRVNGLKVPRGNYYLCDNEYTNSEGFLTPYKGVRYHLKEWGPDNRRPENAREMFNMRHTKARNVIERAFGILKMRWGILRSATYYPIKVQNRLIMACFLLHNFIRTEMEVDPIEQVWDDIAHQNDDDEPQDVEFVDVVESSSEWNRWRDDLATSMWHN
ncbi:uncharacterized protein LOC130993865 [Salvia miltiorrhiza]|uniref:uncharacterized protein LOC130993865 n=1 Tax=Salvia miltiorrhiza TaxID=226208 RepID=UPI0025AD5AA8|nr:uncharacterized protein LOC130993865 [Salvia miltiorrhiza]